MKKPALALLAILMTQAGQSALADEAVTAPAAPPAAMSADPCPPPLAVPAALARLADAALVPGQRASNFADLHQDPDVQAYLQAQQLRAQTDWPNLCRYRSANAALKKPPQVVFIGDSITEIWARDDDVLFSNDVIGRGISGQTSPQILLRFFQDVIELKPRLVHIMAGTNDVAGNTGPTSEQDYKHNIMAMVELARAHHIEVALASIPPASTFPWKPALKPAATIAALNRWLREYASKSGSRYIDYYSVLADSQGGFRAELSNDGVHPNHDGYAVMKKLTLPAIGR
jgi:lysophospholipase L1-like esterase